MNMNSWIEIENEIETKLKVKINPGQAEATIELKTDGSREVGREDETIGVGTRKKK